MTDAPKMVVYTEEDGLEAAGPWTPTSGPVEYIRADAPELLALTDRLRRVIAHYAVVHAGPQGGFRTTGQTLLADASAALAAFDDLAK